MNRRIATYVLYLIGLLFIGSIIVQAWPELLATIPNINLYYIGLSTLAILAHTLIGCGLLKQLLITSGVTINYANTCKIFYLSQPAKYLPGVIWGFALQASLVTTKGAMKKVTFANIKYLLFIISFFSFSSLAILFYEESLLLSMALLGFSYLSTYLICSLSFIDILPSIFRKIMPGLFEAENTKMDMPTVQVFIICLILFVTYALSIAFITLSFYQFSFYDAMEIAVYQCLAWVIGILTFIVPAGMGVREAAFILIANFTDNFSTQQMQSIAVLTRTIQMLQDIALSLVALLLVRTRLL